MPGDNPTLMRRLLVRIRALLPEDWRGPAGERFRNTTKAITEYVEEHVRPAERIAEAPDLGWRALQGAATQKHSEAAWNYAKEELERIRIVLERRTLEAKVRKEDAEASKAESEARMMQMREFENWIEFADKFRAIGAVPVWGPDGRLHIRKAPAGFDWDEMVSEKFPEPIKLFAPPPPDEIRGSVNVTLGSVTAETAVGNVSVTVEPSTSTSSAEVGTHDDQSISEDRRGH